jgi:probable HAF family extracellular repeat protein
MNRIKLCLTLTTIAALVVASSAQTQSRAPAQASYLVFTLSTLGGTVGAANAVNNLGWVMGDANLAGDKTQQATLWIERRLIKLGTLGGPNSVVPWPAVKNNKGLIVGVSDTSIVQPLGEVWSCALAFYTVPASGNTCQGFLWRDGFISPVPTLGGDNGVATGVNNHGQVVGWAETPFHDPSCNFPQVLQFEAYVYDAKTAQIAVLSPFGNDPDSAATAINDSGQVVGISGLCSNAVGGASAIHAVLWENGAVSDLGNLGGLAWNTPTSINNNGDVVGFGNTSGDQNAGFSPVAFLWTKSGGMQSLGTLPGDSISIAWGINNQGQIVGQSIGPNGSRAFLYQNGTMTPLNALIGKKKLTLVYANDINDFGEIVGGAFNPKTGKSPAFLAVPAP